MTAFLQTPSHTSNQHTNIYTLKLIHNMAPCNVKPLHILNIDTESLILRRRRN